MRGSDLLVGAVLGALVGLGALFVLDTAAAPAPDARLLLVAPPVLAPLVLYAASLAGGERGLPYEFSKFALVGVLNVVVDLAVLNLLMRLSGHVDGPGYAACKFAGFFVAVVNSYLWNRAWTFRALTGRFATFLAVSIGGLLVNVGVAYGVVEWVSAPTGISPIQWASVGGMVASVSAMVWNFAGYRMVVFDREPARAATGGLAGEVGE